MNLKKALQRNHASMLRQDRERQEQKARAAREAEARLAAAMEPLQVAMLAQAVRVFELTRNIPRELMFERIERAKPGMAAKVRAEVEELGPMTAWEMAQAVATYARLVTLEERK